MDILMEPAVVAALVAGAVTIVAPWLASRLKRAENGRIGQATLEVRRLDTTEQYVKNLLEHQRVELVELRERVDELEKERDRLKGRLAKGERRYDRVLAALADVARELRDELEDDPRKAIADRMVKAISQARDLFDRRETA